MSCGYSQESPCLRPVLMARLGCGKRPRRARIERLVAHVDRIHPERRGVILHVHRFATAHAVHGPLQQPPTASAALTFAVSLLSAPPCAGAVHISEGVAPAQGVEAQVEMETQSLKAGNRFFVFSFNRRN